MNKKQPIRYALIAPCVSLPGSSHKAYTYHYEAPQPIAPGQVVRIPFGKRSITGIVLQGSVRRPSYPTKAISTILPVIISEMQLQYAQWIADISHGGLGYTLRLFLPSGI